MYTHIGLKTTASLARLSSSRRPSLVLACTHRNRCLPLFPVLRPCFLALHPPFFSVSPSPSQPPPSLSSHTNKHPHSLHTHTLRQLGQNDAQQPPRTERRAFAQGNRGTPTTHTPPTHTPPPAATPRPPSTPRTRSSGHRSDHRAAATARRSHRTPARSPTAPVTVAVPRPLPTRHHTQTVSYMCMRT